MSDCCRTGSKGREFSEYINTSKQGKKHYIQTVHFTVLWFVVCNIMHSFIWSIFFIDRFNACYFLRNHYFDTNCNMGEQHIDLYFSISDSLAFWGEFLYSCWSGRQSVICSSTDRIRNRHMVYYPLWSWYSFFRICVKKKC